MRTFRSISEFAAHLRMVSMAISEAEHVGLDEAATLIEKQAKAEIGEELPQWPALADSTVREKEALGFTGSVSGTDPMLRTGELRDSISHEVGNRIAVVGSDDPVAIYQETGTSRIPPRPFLSTAAFREGAAAASTVGLAVANAVAGFRPERGR